MDNSMNDIKNQKWAETFFTKSLLAGITFLTAIVNLIVAINKLVEGESFIAIVATAGFVIFSVIFVIAFSLRTVQLNSGVKSKKDYDIFVTKISTVTHDLLHRLRNSIYYMEDAYNNNKFDNERDFEQYVTQEILQLVDFLAIELTKVLGTETRACIKCLNYTTSDEDDADKMNLITFARSGQKNINEIMQEHRKPIIQVEKNTDFLEILQSGKNKRQRQYFYEKNLKQFDENLRKVGSYYKNSNEVWDKDYITTIVCPIRLQRKEETLEDSALIYDLIGFLCVDSLDENAFVNEYSDFCFDLLKGLSDILYVYLDNFIEYYSDIKGEVEVNG